MAATLSLKVSKKTTTSTFVTEEEKYEKFFTSHSTEVCRLIKYYRALDGGGGLGKPGF